jgi:hypothetical protein
MSVLRGEAARRVLDRMSYNRRHATTMRPSRVGVPGGDHRLPAARHVPTSEHTPAGSAPGTSSLARAAGAVDA